MLNIPGMPQMPADYSERMIEYLKLFQNTTKEIRKLCTPFV